MRPVLFALCALLLATTTVLAWPPARVAVQALGLLPALFPAAPFEPLSLLTAAPTREQRSYSYAGGSVDADLYEPSGGGRHGAVILLLGAGDLPRGDLAVPFAEALARTGLVALVPESSGMFEERLTFDEVDAIRASVALLRDRPTVDPDRIGIVGLSASGGLALAAAGQPDLATRIRLVNSFGSYSNAQN